MQNGTHLNVSTRERRKVKRRRKKKEGENVRIGKRKIIRRKRFVRKEKEVEINCNGQKEETNRENGFTGNGIGKKKKRRQNKFV